MLAFVVAVIYGYTLDLFLFALSGISFDTMWLRWVMLIIGDVFTGFGVACFFRTYLPLQVYELFVADGKVTIRCSGAKRIAYFTAGRRRAQRVAPKGGELLTEATFEIDPNDVYFRIEVRDEDFEHACTRGYWLDELDCFKTEETAE